MAESTGYKTAFGPVFTDFKGDLVPGIKVSPAGAVMEAWFALFFGGCVAGSAPAHSRNGIENRPLDVQNT